MLRPRSRLDRVQRQGSRLLLRGVGVRQRQRSTSTPPTRGVHAKARPVERRPYSYLPKQLRGRPYQVVLEDPGSDPRWSMRAVGFGPCGAKTMVRYYAPVRC